MPRHILMDIYCFIMKVFNFQVINITAINHAHILEEGHLVHETILIFCNINIYHIKFTETWVLLLSEALKKDM